ncbi:tRNA (guanine-N(7)-)-methyltransferase non-catalytic subunit trm82 [Coniosporium tulheliwenetii]|nr:tRNA (guanine-N(7)-)-methyltransferase non-catalytic subunit trm82 [Cladosporium sp. JES 115]
MPKRPCAITLTADDNTILCGDKFGDVYGLPLLSSPEADAAAARQQEEAASKSFVPSATNLTVHSGRNRKALENQLKSANQQAKTKEPLKFAHELLLGHVSMLTDVAFVAFDEVTSLDRKPRSYILTSDRDEHIRISRAPPQAHIIEGYCLGHKEFVSKLCLPKPGILVSGGGDDEVFVWDWRDSRLIDKISLRNAVFKTLSKRPGQGATKVAEDDVTIAVSGMWTFESAARNETRVLVACEGVPALFHFSTLNVGDEQHPTNLEVLLLSGNPLDVAVLEDSIIVSIDNCHESGSISVARQDQTTTPRLQAFEYASSEKDPLNFSWRPDERLDGYLQKANSQPTAEPVPDPKALADLLYGIENLRKRGGEEAESS